MMKGHCGDLHSEKTTGHAKKQAAHSGLAQLAVCVLHTTLTPTLPHRQLLHAICLAIVITHPAEILHAVIASASRQSKVKCVGKLP